MRELAEGDLGRVSGKVLSKAARQGDALALSIVHEAARILGLGVVTLLHIFNPEIIVFGGGVSFGLGELLFEPMRDTVREHVIDSAYYERVRYEMAALGENVSIVGAGALVATRGGVDDVRTVIARLDTE
jgi:glucokinase